MFESPVTAGGTVAARGSQPVTLMYSPTFPGVNHSTCMQVVSDVTSGTYGFYVTASCVE